MISTIYTVIHLLLGLRLLHFDLGIWQALYPRFLELPGQLLQFRTTVTLGQKETEKLVGNSDGLTMPNSNLVAVKVHALATP